MNFQQTFARRRAAVAVIDSALSPHGWLALDLSHTAADLPSTTEGAGLRTLTLMGTVTQHWDWTAPSGPDAATALPTPRPDPALASQEHGLSSEGPPRRRVPDHDVVMVGNRGHHRAPDDPAWERPDKAERRNPVVRKLTPRELALSALLVLLTGVTIYQHIEPHAVVVPAPATNRTAIV